MYIENSAFVNYQNLINMNKLAQQEVQQQVSCYVNGLKDYFQAEVGAFNWWSLPHAKGSPGFLKASTKIPSKLSSWWSPKDLYSPQRPKSWQKSTLPRHQIPTPALPTIKRLFPTKIQECRRRNLCYNCDEVCIQHSEI